MSLYSAFTRPVHALDKGEEEKGHAAVAVMAKGE